MVKWLDARELDIIKWLNARESDITVASEKDDKMSETMIGDKNLPNPHLFKPLFYSRT